ncbi:MAG: F-box domain-containing protein [Gammaproteobacteria bacterium]|nr:MAG: F-box domain-containing protein [Gammaproteobacteria bacterium]
MWSWLKYFKNEPKINHFTAMPMEVIKNIVSFLPFKDRAYLASTNKEMHTIVADTPTKHIVIELIATENSRMGIARSATYTEISRILKQRIPLERKIQTIEDSNCCQRVIKNMLPYPSDRSGFALFLNSGLAGGCMLFGQLFIDNSLTTTEFAKITALISPAILLGLLQAYLARAIEINEMKKDELQNELDSLPSILPKP